ncbi:MAG: LPS export ABC transporter permease LptG [Zoogloeaceae bacterium]|nr:LPS export ABC transporter permease LptG [Zoogloeaceae bacterium]
MKLYERHIGRELVFAILLVLLALLALYAFFDTIESLKDVGRGQFGTRHAFLYVGLRLPGRIYELLPIAVLIGALYALSDLSRHSELAVLRASGLSARALLVLLFKIAGVFALFTLLLGEILLPPAERTAQEMRAHAIHSVVAQEFISGLWVKDGRSFVNIRSATPDSRLSGLRIYQFDAENHLQYVMDAEQGEFVRTGQWRLFNVARTSLPEIPGSETESGGAERREARVERQTEFLWESALSPDLISVVMVSPERMSLVSLVLYLRHLSSNQQKTERYAIAFWKKILYPAAALVMAALALPFGVTHGRAGGVSLQIFAGVMIGVLFHMLSGLFSSLGILRAWPPVLAAAAPSLLFLLAAFALLWRIERR